MIQPLIYAAYHLDFEQLKDICLATISVPFFISDQETDINAYKKTQGLNDLTP